MLKKSKFVVIGGAGAMGRITVKDLFETCPKEIEIVIADYDLKKAHELADVYRKIATTGIARPTVTAAFVDVRDVEKTAQLLTGAFCVINTVQYQYNLDVMKAALKSEIHCLDLGGLFHMTREQMQLHDSFLEINKIAILGIGAAPGITNLLSAHGVSRLDTVQEIHTRVASYDETKYVPKPALSVSYSLKTILEEFSFEPAIYTKGEFKFVEAMSGAEIHRFPPPIGTRRPMYTIHSEVATLPLSFKHKGVREVSFKIAFDQKFTEHVRFLRDLGFGSHKPIEVSGVQVSPIDVVNKIAMSQKPSKQIGKLKQHEVVRAIVKGKKDNKKYTIILDCHTQGMPNWGIGLDINTGSPPSIAAQMLYRNQITARGALAAEKCIEPELFFEYLKARKMRVTTTKRPGWSFHV